MVISGQFEYLDGQKVWKICRTAGAKMASGRMTCGATAFFRAIAGTSCADWALSLSWAVWMTTGVNDRSNCTQRLSGMEISPVE